MQKLVGIIVGAALCLAGTASAVPAPVTLCHRPPGNPEHGFKITVGGPSVPAHLAHGDTRPLTCDDIDACGPQDDGCGGTLDCGVTCAGVGANCGALDDGCGGPLDCGDCAAGDKCIQNICDDQH